MSSTNPPPCGEADAYPRLEKSWAAVAASASDQGREEHRPGSWRAERARAQSVEIVARPAMRLDDEQTI